MGRVREYIRVNGKEFWTLFDSGARNTYVVPEVAALLATTKLPRAFRSALGGSVKKATKAALLVAQVEGHHISTNAMVLNDIGRDEDDKPIEVLFGALAMQQWGIRLVPAKERLDLTHYPKECVEFFSRELPLLPQRAGECFEACHGRGPLLTASLTLTPFSESPALVRQRSGLPPPPVRRRK